MAKAKKAAAAADTPAPKTAEQPTEAKAPVSAEQRFHYVEVAAYYIAQQRGFTAGDPAADWIAAETEIDRLLAEGVINA